MFLMYFLIEVLVKSFFKIDFVEQKHCTRQSSEKKHFL